MRLGTTDKPLRWIGTATNLRSNLGPTSGGCNLHRCRSSHSSSSSHSLSTTCPPIQPIPRLSRFTPLGTYRRNRGAQGQEGERRKVGEIDECLYEGAVRAGSVKWDEVVSQKWKLLFINILPLICSLRYKK